MPKHRLADLTRAVERAADEWPQKRSATNQAHAFERYNSAAMRLINDVEASEPLTGKEMTRQPAPFGIRLMFRTCYVASLVAKDSDMSLAELSAAVRDPRSFDTLDALQRTSPVVADRAEGAMGLIPTDRAIRSDLLARWQFFDGALAFEASDQTIKDAKERTYYPRTEGECPMRKAKLDRPIFAGVVSICERDENLFERSLS